MNVVHLKIRSTYKELLLKQGAAKVLRSLLATIYYYQPLF